MGDFGEGRLSPVSCLSLVRIYPQGFTPLNFPIVFPTCSLLAATGNARDSRPRQSGGRAGVVLSASEGAVCRGSLG